MAQEGKQAAAQNDLSVRKQPKEKNLAANLLHGFAVNNVEHEHILWLFLWAVEQRGE